MACWEAGDHKGVGGDSSSRHAVPVPAHSSQPYANGREIVITFGQQEGPALA